MSNPKITILLASYNRKDFLMETLDSIICQTYTNWECLITDDGSQEDTLRIIDRFCKQDERFHFYSKPNKYPKGLAATRNFGLELAEKRNAEFVQFFDDDDLMYPQKLEKQIIPLLRNRDLNFSVCLYEKLNFINHKWERDRPDFKIEFPHLGDAILTGDFRMNSLSPLWRFDFLRGFRFQEKLLYAEEWELYTRMGYAFPDAEKYIILEEYLFGYRKHPDSLTLGKNNTYKRRSATIICRESIFEYLNKNNIHTHTSIKYFAKTFTAYGYDQHNLSKLKLYLIKNNYSLRSQLVLQLMQAISHFGYRLLGKSSTWI